MGTITPTVCRAFVNSVVNCYDGADVDRDIFDSKAFPDLENLFETVESTNPQEPKKTKYTKEQKLAICAKGDMGWLLAVTKAFDPQKDQARVEQIQLIQAEVTARLEKLIKNNEIHLRDPVSHYSRVGAQFIQDLMTDILDSLPENVRAAFPDPMRRAPDFFGDSARLLVHMVGSVITASPEKRAAIVNQLQPFDAKLNTYSFWLERKVLNIQRTIAAYTPSNQSDKYYAYIALNVFVALGLVGRVLQPRIVQFFVATVAPQAQNLLYKYGSITVINLCEKTCAHAVTLIAYVVNTRVYYWLYKSGFFYTRLAQQVAAVVGVIIWPVGYALRALNFIHFPVNFIAMGTGRFVYNGYFSPAAKFQQKLIQSLVNMPESPEKEKCIEESIKVYQVWIYLMTEGAREIHLPPADGG